MRQALRRVSLLVGSISDRVGHPDGEGEVGEIAVGGAGLLFEVEAALPLVAKDMRAYLKA